MTWHGWVGAFLMACAVAVLLPDLPFWRFLTGCLLIGLAVQLYAQQVVKINDKEQ